MMVELRDPDRCRCGQRGRIVNSRRGKGYRRRRHACRACNHRWTTYESLINPRKIVLRK